MPKCVDKVFSFLVNFLYGPQRPGIEIQSVESRIREMGSHPTKKIRQHKYILVHRNTLARSLTKLATYFKTRLGWPVPYHILVTRRAKAEWGVNLDFQTPAAAAANPYAIHVAVDHDMRKTPLPDDMYDCLVGTLIFLKLMYPECEIQGHMEKNPEARSKDPKKECPGRHLDLNQLRSTVSKCLPT